MFLKCKRHNMTHSASKFTAPSIVCSPTISTQPTITNGVLKSCPRAILHLTFTIFICLIVLRAAAVAVRRLELPLVLEANKNVVQQDAGPYPSLRSKMIVRRGDFDGDGVQGSQPTLQYCVDMLNAASRLALRIIEFLQRS